MFDNLKTFQMEGLFKYFLCYLKTSTRVRCNNNIDNINDSSCGIHSIYSIYNIKNLSKEKGQSRL